jgi:ABC-type nitrate/sulfonate/bicarbonate transport system substrate-binding protein
MTHPSNLCRAIVAGTGLLLVAPMASAEETLKVAAAQRGAWESSIPELGQQAGIFKKHGLVLDIAYTQDAGATEQRAIAGNVDVGVDASAMSVLRAYSRGAPVRIIGANTTGDAKFWYVLASSPIRTVKDFVGRTIAYATNGSSSHYDALDFMKQFRIKARLAPTGNPAATFAQLNQNHVDIAWASPPFGLDELEQGKIRVVARANDVPRIREKTANVLITNVSTLEKRKSTIARFMQAYRETVEWMYADPAALKQYAALAGVSEKGAQRLRDELFSKDMLMPDQIVGFKAIMKDAVTLRYIQTTLSRSQEKELIQIPAPVRDALSGCQGDRAGCAPTEAVVSP